MSKAKGKKGNNSNTSKSASALHGSLCVNGGDGVANTVQLWLSRYEDDNVEGVRELATLMVAAAGSGYELTREEVENVDAEGLTKKLVTEEFKIATSYPLEKERSVYADNYGTFWNQLILQAGDALFDEYLLGHLQVWVEMLSNWEVRSFRYVGTVTGNHVVGALIQLRKKRSKELESVHRGKKKAPSKSSQQQLDADSERISQLDGFIDQFFNAVFVIRYRDVSPDIRSLCIRALGEWIPEYDAVMMDTKYVKYLGWALYDPKAPVRMAAVKVLTVLYSNASYVHQLEKFTTRFHDRLGAVPDDKDISVAVAGIKMCGILAKAGKLDQVHVDHIYELLLDKNSSIRTASAEFAASVYFDDSVRADAGQDEDDNEDDHDDNAAGKGGRRRKGKKAVRKRSPAQQSLLSLVEFVRLHNPLEKRNPDTVVHALWTGKAAPWLRDWDALCSTLLEDDQITADQQVILARTAVAALTIVSHSTSKNDRKELGLFSASFVGVAHRLLERFKAEPDVAVYLAGLVAFVDPQAFGTQQESANHNKLVTLLGELVLEHANLALVTNSVVALTHLSKADTNPYAAQAATVLERTREQIMANFLEAGSALLESAATADVDPDVSFALAGALLRLSAAYKYLDLSLGSDALGMLKRVLDDRVAGVEGITDETIVFAMQSEMLNLLWSLQRALKNVEGLSDENVQDALIHKRDDVIFHFERLMSASFPEPIRCAAITGVLDVLRTFGAYLTSKGFPRLRVTCSQSLCDTITGAFHGVMDHQITNNAAVTPQRKKPITKATSASEGEDDEDNEARESLQSSALITKQLELVSALARGVGSRIVPISVASHVLAHYGSAAARVKEEMRSMLSKLRKDAETQGKGQNEYKIVLQTLKTAFERFREGNEYDEDRLALRALSVGLVRTYGTSLNASLKASLVLLMQEAAPYALSLGDVGFVFLRECLMPFTSKMPQPEKILQFFEGLAMPDCDDSPYLTSLEEFHNHLRKLADPSAFKTPLSKRSKKGANPRMQLQMEGESNDSVGVVVSLPSQQQDNEGDDEEEEEYQQTPPSRASTATKKKSTTKKSASSTGKKKRGSVAVVEDNDVDDNDDDEDDAVKKRRSAALDDKGKEELYPLLQDIDNNIGDKKTTNKKKKQQQQQQPKGRGRKATLVV